MIRFLCVCLLSLSLLITGCTALRVPQPLDYLALPFSAEGELTVSDTVFSVRADVQSAQRGTVTFLSPQAVSGMTVSLTADGVLWTYADHTVMLSEDNPACRTAVSFLRALAVPAPDLLVRTDDGFTCEQVTYLQPVCGAFPSEIVGASFRFRASMYYPGGKEATGQNG